MESRPTIARACPAAVAAVLVLAMSAGCVQRRMTIRSNPPGALVYVDDYQIGTTPVSHDFVYYGTRKVRLVKDGYETLTVRQPIPLPWYEIFPLDFVTENLIPWEVRDERVIDLAMQPASTEPAESVAARAEQARLAAGSLPPVAPATAVTAAPAAVPRPMPAPPPALPPMQQFGPRPAPSQGLVLPPPAPPQGLAPPPRNAPAQGIPSLGAPPSFVP